MAMAWAGRWVSWPNRSCPGLTVSRLVPSAAICRLKSAWLELEMPVTQIETPGLHTWLVWRDNLVHFTPLLFQQK